MHGTIKKIHADKGFGFIRPDNGPPDVFFHRSGCEGFDQLQDGQAVDYDEEASPKGPRAKDVRAGSR